MSNARLQTCAQCDEPTGKSNEDELYFEPGTNREPVGPLCQSCYDEMAKVEEDPDFTCRTCYGTGGHPDLGCHGCGGSGEDKRSKKAYFDSLRGDEEYDRQKDEGRPGTDTGIPGLDW